MTQTYTSQDTVSRPVAPGTGRTSTPAPVWRDRDPRYRRPWLAILLSFLMPGLGQVYVGYYRDAFVNIAVIGSVIALLSSGMVPGLEPLLGMFLAFFWLYQTVDAGRRATLYDLYLVNRAGEGGDLPELGSLPHGGDARLAGVVMVVVGVLAFLHTRFGLSLAWLETWWPLFLVVAGAWLWWRGRD